MSFRIEINFHNAGPHTIWGKLAEKLGRDPTRQEAADEVRRILAQTASATRAPRQQR